MSFDERQSANHTEKICKYASIGRQVRAKQVKQLQQLQQLQHQWVVYSYTKGTLQQ
jgi:hypothetical protein